MFPYKTHHALHLTHEKYIVPLHVTPYSTFIVQTYKMSNLSIKSYILLHIHACAHAHDVNTHSLAHPLLPSVALCIQAASSTHLYLFIHVCIYFQ